MAVFRVEKTRDYTVMANHHLRNIALSLKAKGLLSLMLSLPDDWDYTLKGLARICRDGVDSIAAAVNELEEAGYIVRKRVRDDKGRVRDMDIQSLSTRRKIFHLNGIFPFRKTLFRIIQRRKNLNRKNAPN